MFSKRLHQDCLRGPNDANPAFPRPPISKCPSQIAIDGRVEVWIVGQKLSAIPRAGRDEKSRCPQPPSHGTHPFYRVKARGLERHCWLQIDWDQTSGTTLRGSVHIARARPLQTAALPGGCRARRPSSTSPAQGLPVRFVCHNRIEAEWLTRKYLPV